MTVLEVLEKIANGHEVVIEDGLWGFHREDGIFEAISEPESLEQQNTYLQARIKELEAIIDKQYEQFMELMK